MHIFWLCPRIQKIWEELEKILGQLPMSLTQIPPGMALLHLKTMDLPPRERLIYNHIFIVTRMLIVENWKSSVIPTIEEILKKVDFNLKAERSWAIRCGDLQAFQKRASLWPSIYPESKLSVV
ncbi:hypothetical protein XELAEV_18020974mg [Xenopus laevis]|uniref:Uncharacterized protein n=1 Tax=Xenopus laevis TaxID=8355 RepID=A0A974DAM8_XENLA|nr:hypothetical protein XELAEV_18020974mg [Xenopus laevis]